MEYHRQQSLTAQDLIAGGGDFASILARSIRRTSSPLDPPPSLSASSNHGDDNNDDWNTHHISYHLLNDTLEYFANRRCEIIAKLNNESQSSSVSISQRCVTPSRNNRNVMSLDEYKAFMDEYEANAPFSEEGKEYENVRSLGKTPPGGGRNKKLTAANNASTADATATASDYINMDHTNNSSNNNNSNEYLTEKEIIDRLSHQERCELSALLDREVEKAATFYRAQIAQLSPPREDGGTKPNFLCAEGCDLLHCGLKEEEEDLSAPVGAATAPTGSHPVKRPSFQSRHSSLESNDLLMPDDNTTYPSLSFTEMAHEILELHAYITTNIIVIRQVLIRYDAFVRSLGGSPMSSWYQTSRRGKVKGRSSDYRDLVLHSKLVRLSKAYCTEHKRYEMEANSANRNNNDEKDESRKKRKGRRLQELSKAFYKLVDSAEEMKKRQRMKWRQGVMDVEGIDNLDENALPEDRKNATTIPLEERTTTPPPYTTNIDYPDGLDDTPLQSDPTPQPPRYYNTQSLPNQDMGEDIAYQIYIFKCIQSKTQRSIEKTSTGHISGWWDNAIATIRDYFLMGSTSDNLSLMPQFLIMRGKSLKRELLIVAQWRETRLAYLQDCGDKNGQNLPEQQQQQPFDKWFGGFCGETRPDSAEDGQKTTFKAKLALAMNILACFFYMMNYYIVEPSSTRYANALGMGDAMSGLIIGAMPWAAMMSAVLYSIWSNHNYRQPLLASGFLLVSGNLLYASAYRRNSITMALCGRFLTGLGGPRSMNRRYIADTTPLAYRTSVNAAFGTATAMGAALGPATAIMIDGVELEFNLPLYGTVYFNAMTGPGFIMGGLWILFTLLLACTFEEPERSGLEEQKRKEMKAIQASALSSPVTMEMSNLEAPSKSNLNHTGSDEFVSQQPGQTTSATPYLDQSFNCTGDNPGLCIGSDTMDEDGESKPKKDTICSQLFFVLHNITVPVRICMFLLFSKMFTVESVISAASMVTKNRYGWQIQQVGSLGTIVGCLTIPISIFIGWVSQYREDRVLMLYLMSFATLGMALLVDVTDFVDTDTVYYNKGNPFAVGPQRYIAGYLLVFCSVQAFDGVVGSVLSKVIPTALATGTLNSGLLATVVGTVSAAITVIEF